MEFNFSVCGEDDTFFLPASPDYLFFFGFGAFLFCFVLGSVFSLVYMLCLGGMDFAGFG